MDKKMIQEQRKKGYFIESAKQIIREDGVENLTVKKVADLAGFASGTMYNYFADLHTLLAYCAVDFWQECKEYVLQALEDHQSNQGKIIDACQAYMNYFFDNQNVFKLMFIGEFGEIPPEVKEKVLHPEVVLLLSECFQEAALEGAIPQENLKKIENIIANYLHGILLFQIMGRAKESREEMHKLLEDNIDYLIK